MFDHDRNIATDTLCIRLVSTRRTPTLIYRKLLPRYRVGRRYFFRRSREWINDRGALNANKMLGTSPRVCFCVNFISRLHYVIFATRTRDCRNSLHNFISPSISERQDVLSFADNISKIIISFSRRTQVACARIASELGQGSFTIDLSSDSREHVSVAVTYLRSRIFRKISGVL